MGSAHLYDGPLIDYSAFPLPKLKRVRREEKHDGRLVSSPGNWRKLREKLCKRAGEMCERCGRPTELSEGHAHHIQRRGIGGGKRSDDPGNLKFLCEWCHRKEHE